MTSDRPIDRLRAVLAVAACCLAFFSPIGPVHADVGQSARNPVHVEIVLDSSGSMSTNDPERLSVFAAMIFTDLVGPADRLGVLSMQKSGYVLDELGPVEGERDAIRRAVSGLAFGGPTDCAGPLLQASRDLQKSKASASDARQFVIFLSDGVCPIPTQTGVDPVRDAAEQLAAQGVMIFSIGMFGEEALMEGDPSKDLRAMADVSGGEYFRATSAADLPRRFASILGRIVGSQAQKVPVSSGQPVRVQLDGYVWDASLIVTGSGKSVVVESATAPDATPLALPDAEPPFAERKKAFFASAQTNRADQHYEVLRIQEPKPGQWTFIVEGPPDVEALLIQNYALDPVLEISAGARPIPPGESFEAHAWLKGRDGSRIEDRSFLEKVTFTLESTVDGGEAVEVPMTYSKDGRFTATLSLKEEGKHRLIARAAMKKGGLDKPSEPVDMQTLPLILKLAEGQGALDFGAVKAGDTSAARSVDLGASQVPTESSLTLKLEGAPGVEIVPDNVMISPKKRSFEVQLRTAEDHSGGPLDGSLTIRRGASAVKVPVRAEIVPLTFWEKWGKIILTIAVGVGGLLLLLFVLYGIISPFSFPPDARLNWGKDLERLNKNEILIREIPGTGRGFYRNAKITIGGPRSFLPAGGAELAVLEATGPNRITLRSADGVTLEKINKFDPDKTKVIEEGETGMHTGEIYRIGEIYFRLQ